MGVLRRLCRNQRHRIHLPDLGKHLSDRKHRLIRRYGSGADYLLFRRHDSGAFSLRPSVPEDFRLEDHCSGTEHPVHRHVPSSDHRQHGSRCAGAFPCGAWKRADFPQYDPPDSHPVPKRNLTVHHWHGDGVLQPEYSAYACTVRFSVGPSGCRYFPSVSGSHVRLYGRMHDPAEDRRCKEPQAGLRCLWLQPQNLFFPQIHVTKPFPAPVP